MLEHKRGGSAGGAVMRQRNPEARCGNCPYGENEESIDLTTCVVHPEPDRRLSHRVCGQHPEFFLPEWELSKEDAEELEKLRLGLPSKWKVRGDSEPSTVMATAKVVTGRDGA